MFTVLRYSLIHSSQRSRREGSLPNPEHKAEKKQASSILKVINEAEKSCLAYRTLPPWHHQLNRFKLQCISSKIQSPIAIKQETCNLLKKKKSIPIIGSAYWRSMFLLDYLHQQSQALKLRYISLNSDFLIGGPQNACKRYLENFHSFKKKFYCVYHL